MIALICGFETGVALGAGAEEIGFKQAGADAVVRTARDKLRETISIQDFGGADDWNGTTGTNNYTAFAKIRTDFPNGITIRFPKTGTGVYRFEYLNYGDLNGFTIDPDPGVSFSLPNHIIKTQTSLKVTRPLLSKFTDQNTFYTLRPDVNWGEKNEFLTNGDLYYADSNQINVTNETKSYLVGWPNGPFTATTDGVTATSRSVSHSANAGIMRATLTPAVAEAEYSAAFGAGLDGMILFVVRTTKGFYAFNHNTASNSMSIHTKLDGIAGTDVKLPFDRFGSQQAYWPGNANLTIRINNPQSFSVMYSGVVMYTENLTTGTIVDCGFGFQSNTNSTVTINDWVVTYNKSPGGLGEIAVAVFGDSIADGIVNGAWPYHMRDALDYSFGARVTAINNVAYSGDNSANQLDLMKSPTNPHAADGIHTMGGATAVKKSQIVVIAVGTNDIQSGTAPTTTESNIGAMIDYSLAAHKPVIVVMPMQFYSHALAGGAGQNTANYKDGSAHRQRIARLCAEKGVLLVEMPQFSGPLLPQHISEGINALSDNIHPDSQLYRTFGYLMARAVAGVLAPRASKTAPEETIPTSWISASWSGGSLAVTDGEFSLHGLIDRGANTYIDGDIVMTLPETFWPMETYSVPVSTQTSGGTFSMSHIQVSENGEVRLYGAPSQYVYLAGVSYPIYQQ